MNQLKDKKILFLSVRFFGYENVIAQRLQEWGAEVDFYDERPSNSVLTKGIIRFSKKLLNYTIKKYYRKILEETSGRKYDFFLLIKGEAVPSFFLESFRKQHPETEMIYYNFDSLEEYPALKSHLPYFSSKFTFDRKDAQNYGLQFRPLFFIDDYRSENLSQKEKKYDLSFIGSAHTDRYLVGEKIKFEAENFQLKTFFYYYTPGRTAFILKRIFDTHFKYFDIRKVSYKKLNHSDIISIYKQSKAILDINKPFQNGLTIRTFEVLASGRKLITTNPDIVHYPFYNPENILVVERENINLNPDFFNSPFQNLDEKTLYMMSLDSWIECLFVKNQDSYWNTSGF
ncbi:MAG: hypothetical protein QM564_13835 [Bergeyella sp.]